MTDFSILSIALLKINYTESIKATLHPENSEVAVHVNHMV